MNEFDIKIMGLYTRIDKNNRLSKQLKALAGVCVFFSICYCLGTMSIENIKKRIKNKKPIRFKILSASINEEIFFKSKNISPVDL